jgi:hypothetical protein
VRDDREEFEKDLNADETSLDQEAWALDEASEDRGRRFTAAMERLDAEVAAHETPEPGISNPRFGDRLRRFEVDMAAVHGLIWPNLKRIAYLIDQDAKSQAVRLGAKRGREREHLRRQIEEAVGRGRYTWGGAFETDRKDVLDAEPFVEALARIFGERAESPQKVCPACEALVEELGRARYLVRCSACGWEGNPGSAPKYEPAAERREP